MLIARMLANFPKVRRQLKEYRNFLAGCPGPLARQALDSIRDKEFHCLGGSVYALLAGRDKEDDALRFIVAFQTISDYLDNLCDRMGVQSEPAFRRLHASMLDCLTDRPLQSGDYYALFPEGGDGGYLRRLVDDCRAALAQIGLDERRRRQAQQLTRLYIDLQSYKHLRRKTGEEKLAGLYRRHAAAMPGLYWWEFAAACGSTLGVFCLAAAPDCRGVYRAYMPWVCGLHILLDYFIDQEEDEAHGDMNLVSYYSSEEMQLQRLLLFYARAREEVKYLANSAFHTMVADGLLALYLSDPKARSPVLRDTGRRLLAEAGLRPRVLCGLARVLRRAGVL